MRRNLSVPEKHSVRKKVRGSKRKLQSFGRKLDSILLSIPDEALPHDKSWRYHLPSPGRIVDSTNSSFKLRKKFVQLLSERLTELDIGIKGKYKTLLFLSLPLLSHSRIEVCVDRKHFEELTNNPDTTSTWSPIAESRSIIREFSLSLPATYRAKGFSRRSSDLKMEENWIIWNSR